MECTACGTSNAAGSRFCASCGEGIVATCPSCATPNPANARFCNQCGTSLVSTATAIDDPGERRLVTSLFADLVGFTPFSEAHDPEDVREMLVRWFDVAREVVESFGGVIDKYTGDAITAFWGSRRTQEDDATSAVRAGLRLVEEATSLGRKRGAADLQLRVGIATGDTSVGSGGNATGLVVGDLVNVAARLQPLAAPGTVLVSESTRALAAGIEFVPAGSHPLKGVSKPVTTFRAVRVDPSLRPRGVEPPFVGRDPELRLFQDQYAAVASESRARLVSMVGEAGIGKSRLADQARELIAHPGRWFTGRASAHTEGLTFDAVSDVIRQIADLDDSPTADVLEAAVARICPDPEEQLWITPRLAAILGLGPAPTGDRHDLFGACRTFLQRAAATGPMVLVFDDLQWADESLLEFASELVERSRTVPILVITLARPELIDQHPEWGSATHRSTTVHLSPLSDTDMTALVEGMTPGIDPATVGLIVDAAAGIPLYAVEYVRTLIDTGVLVADGDRFVRTGRIETLDVPDSLHAVVGSRLDRMSAEDRSLIRHAAVLGDAFPLRLLELALDEERGSLLPRLDRLARLGILDVDDGPTEAVTVRFVQSTVREIAYRRMSRTERADRHLALVEALRKSGESSDPDVVAAHTIGALEAKPDAAVAEVARTSLLAAARRASGLHAGRRALRLVERAIALPGDDASRLPFWEVGAEAASAVRDHEMAEELARRVVEWHRAANDAEGTLRALVRLGRVLLEAERASDALAALAPAYEPSRADEPTMAWIGALVATAHRMLGAHEQAAAITRDALVAAADLRDPELTGALLRARGLALHRLERSVEATALVREAVRVAAEAGATTAEASGLSSLIWIDGRSGRLRDLSLPERLLDLAHRAGDATLERRAMAWVGRIRTAMGDYRIARSHYDTHDWLVPRADERYDRSRVRYLDWILDADPAALDEADQLLGDAAGDSHEQSSVVVSGRAQLMYARGKVADAFDLAVSADLSEAVPHSFLYDLPIFAALFLGDPERVSLARGRLPTSGERFASLAEVADAGLATLADGSEETVGRFEEAADRHAEVDGPADTAQLHAIAGMIAPHSPTARRAADLARQWFEDHEARGFLALYASAWDAT